MAVVNRPHIVSYDPNTPAHLKAYKTFFETGSWRHTDLRFEVEHPYIDVPTTLSNKTLQHFFNKDNK